MEDAPDEGMALAKEEDGEKKKFNSTSSYYINSTLARPDTDEIVFCVAVVIHDHIVQGEQVTSAARSAATTAHTRHSH